MGTPAPTAAVPGAGPMPKPTLVLAPMLTFIPVPNKLKLVPEPEEEAVDPEPELELELAAEPDLCGRGCAICMSMSPVAVPEETPSEPTPLDLARLFRSLPSPPVRCP